MKNFFITGTILLSFTAASARTLHYRDDSGTYDTELTDKKKTYPALNIKISEEETVYGAMYDVSAVPAPMHTVHLRHNGTEYWVGPWCAWQQYLPADSRECKNIPADAMNRFLTLDEAEKYIVPTDIAQWELISACSNKLCSDDELKEQGITDARSHPECACANGTLQPGTYLFHEYYNNKDTGIKGVKSQIAIFDHPVGYVSIHALMVFETLIDTEHETFESWTMHTPNYKDTQEDANITNLPTGFLMYVYKLN